MDEVAINETVLGACARRGRSPDALLEVLHDVQDAIGHVAPETQRLIAETLNIARAEVHGVISFYDDFRETPPAPTVIRLCRGESCQAQGAGALERHLAQAHGLRLHQRTGNVQLEPVYCLGNCPAGPAAQINGQLVARLTPQQFDDLIGESEK